MTAHQSIVNRDIRDFAAHQVAQELQAGASLADAAARVRTALPHEFQWAVSDIERTLAGGAAPAGWEELETLLRASRDNGIDTARAFAAFQDTAQRVRGQLAAVLAGATSLAAYVASLVGVLLVVICVYAVFVLPQMNSMFDTMGAKLPAFTEAAIGNSLILLPVLAVLALSVIVVLVGLARFRKRIHGLQPLHPLLGRVPILGAWARRFDAGLWMHYFAIFLDAGASEEDARNAARQVTGSVEDDHRARLLRAAATLGRLRPELARQLDIEARESVEEFEKPRDALVLAARLAIYAIISGYVVAMYLPIFKLGAIV